MQGGGRLGAGQQRGRCLRLEADSHERVVPTLKTDSQSHRASPRAVIAHGSGLQAEGRIGEGVTGSAVAGAREGERGASS